MEKKTLKNSSSILNRTQHQSTNNLLRTTEIYHSVLIYASNILF